MAAKRFTREEAEELLPYLAPVLFKLQELKRKNDALQTQVTGVAQKSRGNGHGVDTDAGNLRRETEVTSAQMNELIEKVHSMEVELKDADIGLIDFRSIKDGREVYLCWKLGEEHISHWHELEAGYAGRQPLEEGE